MAQFFSIHPTHPQKRLIRLAAETVRRGGLIAYPTDSCYALGCQLGDARALERRLDLIIDSGACDTQPSTVIDLTETTPQVLRQGKGSLAPFSVESV